MNIAVIDTETNYRNEVISIGVVIARMDDFTILLKRYYVISPECDYPSMYASSLYLKEAMSYLYKKKKVERYEAIDDLIDLLHAYRIVSIFAYNAAFDMNCLYELYAYNWYDILKCAAYKQTNPYISDSMPCFKTGRLKTGYGVEKMVQMMT
ncbi:MAG: hypothetical protein HUJ53_02540, partial [Holdemanella sp.]|nr:hypothetical protein [Holdemanella sp.]